MLKKIFSISAVGLMFVKASLCANVTLLAIERDEGKDSTLILNMENVEELPIHFRSCSDSLHFSDAAQEPSTEGLAEMKASGSGQFSQKSLKALVKRLDYPRPLSIVDLRQESHGFLNGIAVSWFRSRNAANYGKKLSAIEQSEFQLLKSLLKQENVTMYRILSKGPEGDILAERAIPLQVKSALTEKELSNEQIVGYERIPVTDHMRPADEEVDRFVEFVRGLYKGMWLHFHCEAGDGRTTTFMTMYDMMRNAKKVSFDDILDRQWLIGGIRLTTLPSINSWKYSLSTDRIIFLKGFYQYCKDNKDDFKESWTAYRKKIL